ncbi:MAG TPA: hydroxysqualene dehydroxylase HpnE, partial [Candidatus Acidoferrales bacterium]|nr:hydroxysqualene dehydroxylase HpnE [Candidatus Acidoferrales bacterium]
RTFRSPFVGSPVLDSYAQQRDVVVIGGGFAGLAAAVDLAAAGLNVTVLESRPYLGGRAYSFRDDETGEVVDNGQHAMMGCYHHTLAFLDRIGAADKVTRQPNLRVEMRRPDQRSGTIAASALPSPLHAAVAIARYRLLSHAERRRALLGGLRLLAMHRRRDIRLRQETVEQVLVALRQSDNARACFWDPVAIATLNEIPSRAAAAPFAEVIARAFFATRLDSQFVFARVGLSDLYTVDARRFIESRGGKVELRAAVTDVECDDDRVAAVRLRDGRRIKAAAFISAVPPRVLDVILPGVVHAGDFPSSPIVSAHLWLDRAVMDAAFFGCVGTTTQYVFNRDVLAPQESYSRGGQYLSAVISAGYDVVEWDTARIADAVLNDLRKLLPKARDARIVRRVIVKEKHATISTTPDVDRRRPSTRTAFANFFLAGDWTQTGLPATIEGAVVSGNRSAALVAALLGAQ